MGGQLNFELIFKYLQNCDRGDSTEVFINLQKNDDSYGIPHGTLNKKHTSNQEDSPYLPKFRNKTNLSIRIDRIDLTLVARRLIRESACLLNFLLPNAYSC